MGSHTFVLCTDVRGSMLQSSWGVSSVHLQRFTSVQNRTMCMFSWRPKCQMPTMGHQSGLWISLKPKCRRGCAPFHNHKARKAASAFVNPHFIGMYWNLTKFFVLCIPTFHMHNNYIMYIVAMRPYFSHLWQFRWLLCVATMSSLAQFRVSDGYWEAEAM